MFGWLFVYLRGFCMHSCTGRGDRLMPSSSAELLVLSCADFTQRSAFIYAWSDRTWAASKTEYFLSLYLQLLFSFQSPPLLDLRFWKNYFKTHSLPFVYRSHRLLYPMLCRVQYSYPITPSSEWTHLKVKAKCSELHVIDNLSGPFSKLHTLLKLNWEDEKENPIIPHASSIQHFIGVIFSPEALFAGLCKTYSCIKHNHGRIIYCRNKIIIVLLKALPGFSDKC